MSRVKRVLAAVLVSALMLVMIATPAVAFIHVTIPAGDGAARSALTTKGAVAQGAQDLPIGNVTKAPTTCPAP